MQYMAEIKKRILSFSNGKTIKLYGNSVAIGKSMEIAEAFTPNIFGFIITGGDGKTGEVFNPHKLTAEEMMELADYNIRMWMDFKDAVRNYGISNTKIFKKEAMI
ncbi:hypothetical protein A9970_02325 [Sphingobacterium sp. UME9]|nr:hypothetical protein [Sphingobacterium sp. UME9]OFV19524.1 hypothetical protein HMPREF3127_04710 [Sphingobacterium sp. HMSC13C05]HAL51260.1 hypothetical protein [Sphingobacterium sp.]